MEILSKNSLFRPVLYHLEDWGKFIIKFKQITNQTKLSLFTRVENHRRKSPKQIKELNKVILNQAFVLSSFSQIVFPIFKIKMIFLGNSVLNSMSGVARAGNL